MSIQQDLYINLKAYNQVSFIQNVPMLRTKLTLFRVPLTHTLTAAATALDRSQDTIHIRRTTPLLVRQDIDAEFLLA